MSVASDARFQSLRASLAAAGPTTAESSSPDPSRRDAAVALVLRRGLSLEVLLIKRATSERDPWSGQMALPGGRREPTDSGLLHTAKRETMEETGLNLDVHGVPLGRLPDVVTQSMHLPKLRISPFVFGVPETAEASVASSKELDAVHWVPLDDLARPEIQSEVVIRRAGFQKRFPSYQVVGEHVWGMTYGILNGLLGLIE